MAATTVAGAATASAPHEFEPSGRAPRAAAARSEQLYAQHHRMVTGLCRALLRDPTEAEDAAQQVFLSAHRSLLNGAEAREPAAWLATIARNECWARIRGRMREPLPSDSAEDVPSNADPVAEALRRADLAALWRAIRALPKQQRDALLLREFGGLRYDELAIALSVTEPAVESLLFRARTRLRAQLQSAAAALAPLARILASGGAPAVAAKAAAIGLGAAAVTGTAVVAPTMLERRPHQSAPARSHALRTVRDGATIAVAQLPPVVRHVVRSTAPLTTAERERHDGGREPVERRDGGGDREHGATTTTSTTKTTTTTGEDTRGGGDRGGTTAPVATITNAELSDEGAGGSGGPDGGSSGSDGGSGGSDGGSSGSDGGSGGSDGGTSGPDGGSGSSGG
jgi:RNA polymerase sigma factor (sigma-70 family)